MVQSAPDDADADAVAVTEAPTPRDTSARVVRRRLGYAGLAGALIFCCLSLTPSLLPRGALLQGAISGVTAVIGYGLGALAGAVVAHFVKRQPSARTRKIAARVLIFVGIPALVLFGRLGAVWQRDLRLLMGMEPLDTRDGLLIMTVAILVFALLLLIARAIRLGTRTLVRLFLRFLPRPVAYAAGVTASVVILVGFVQGFLLSSFVDVANEASSLANGGTTEGIEQPALATLSGSPRSLIPWDSLGLKGRDFAGSASTKAEIATFNGRPALDPIRVYAGLESADSYQEQARLAVREMDRTGAFDRAVIAVITTTGTGWIDENVADSLEYMYGGDTALVGMQYSYLPSWISFLVDKSKATQASEALVGEIRARWSGMPAATRPKLVVFGESLGSYGTETAFDSVGNLTAQTDGALLVGPPFDNPIWQGLTDDREAGSAVWRPVVDQGRTVRFAQNPADLRTPASAWNRPRVVYLQNASDPITWWSPRLLLRSPEWLDHPRGPDVTDDMRFYPVITFWQVTADLAFSNGVPAGHGHRYGSNVVEGWAALLTPPEWSADDSVSLKAILDARQDD
ncbi:alpha/beta-hydrolase family protein [Spirillospora sp. NPDC047279]|uniref:alpha/beta hydrolase n=1 Tax=Spirillospora sp. NPDC047279 TaxID=3155478 RepID=UPI0033FB28B5